MAKNMAVRDMVSGQEGRLVPNSERPSNIQGDFVDIDIYPKGGLFRLLNPLSRSKVTIRGIPRVGGMKIVSPYDATLIGVEQQVLYITVHHSKEEMNNSIVSKLKIASEDAMRTLRESYEIEKMTSARFKATAQDLTKGAEEQLKKYQASKEIIDKDTGKEKKGRRVDELPEEYMRGGM